MEREKQANQNARSFNLQGEGCSIESWNAHKTALKEGFSRLVEEVKTQQRDLGTGAPRPVLKPIALIVARIKSELVLPAATSIPDTLAQSMSALGLAAVATMTLKDKAVRVAKELNIDINAE